MLRVEPTPRPVNRRLLSYSMAAMLLLAVALGDVRPQALAADTTRADSREVKAVFLVNFLSFAGWPPSKLAAPPARLVVAVLGDPGFASVVEKAAAGRSVNGRLIVVQSVDTPEKAVDAHLVFIAGSQSQRLPAVLRALGGASVLTVSDTDGFARDGVAINLYTFDNRVRIEVNSTAAARAGVHLSSNLMRLARIVE
jgi:hypothetical protein